MQPEKITLRVALKSDIPTLRTFEQGVVEAERPLALNLRDSSVQYYDLDALIDSQRAQLLIAENHGVAVACGYLRIDPSKPHNRSNEHGYIGFIYVAPDHRGQGLAQTLIKSLIAWGQDQGLSVFLLDVYNANNVAINVYQNLGFKPNLLEMVLET